MELIDITDFKGDMDNTELNRFKVAVLTAMLQLGLNVKPKECLHMNGIYYIPLSFFCIGDKVPMYFFLGVNYCQEISFCFKSHGDYYVSCFFIDAVLGYKPAKHEKPIDKSKTYLMIDHNTGLYKIGKSKNPKERESTLQSEKPTIELIFSTSKNIERKLHNEFEHQRVRGEWFRLDNNDLLFIYEEFKKAGDFKQHKANCKK